MTASPFRATARLTLAISVLALIAVGCGSDDDAPRGSGGDEPTRLVITSPSTSLSYLPIYVARDRGFFEDEGLMVEVVTLNGPAAGHVSAVLSGEAWGFLGGVEHVMLANARGSQLRTIAALTARAGQFFVSATDIGFDDDPAAALRGKRIAVSPAGQSPNFATVAYLESLGLDPERDVTLIEGDSGARLAAVASGQADVSVSSEPILTKGLLEGVWGKPFFELSDYRPYVQNAVNVPLSTIEKDPDTVARFVRALVRAEASIYEEPEEARRVLAAVNPDLTGEALDIAFQNGIDREQWARDGRFPDGALDAVAEMADGLDAGDGPIDRDTTFDLQFLPEPSG